MRASSTHLCRAILLCAAALAHTGAVAEDIAPGTSSLSGGRGFSEQGGAALYANVCAACHQPDGRGAVGAAAYPSLAGNKHLASTDYLESLLFDGLRGMPRLGRMMSDEQVADVINYIRTHFDNQYDNPISAADVKDARPAGE